MKNYKIRTVDWLTGLVIGLFIGLLIYLSISFLLGSMTLIKTGAILISAILFLLLILPTLKKTGSE
jgi:amino acid transporter